MGLAIQVYQGKPYPRLTCDSCGQPIEDLHGALAAYYLTGGEGILPVHVYHKGHYDIGHVGRREREVSRWLELSRYLPYLLWNHRWGKKGGPRGHATLTIDVPKPLDL